KEAEATDAADAFQFEGEHTAARFVQAGNLPLRETHALDELDVAESLGGCARQRIAFAKHIRLHLSEIATELHAECRHDHGHQSQIHCDRPMNRRRINQDEGHAHQGYKQSVDGTAYELLDFPTQLL